MCAMPYALGMGGMGGMALGALDLGCQMSYPQPEPTRTNPTQASTSFLLVVLSLVTGQRAPLLVAHRTLERSEGKEGGGRGCSRGGTHTRTHAHTWKLRFIIFGPQMDTSIKSPACVACVACVCVCCI